MNKFFIASIVLSFISVSNANEPKESKKPEAQAVNVACAQDSITANCGADKVGTGLLKCIHDYKINHADFKVSDNCKAAMKGLGHVHKQKKTM